MKTLIIILSKVKKGRKKRKKDEKKSTEIKYQIYLFGLGD